MHVAGPVASETGEGMDHGQVGAGEVVSLFPGRAMSFPAIAQVDAYWEGLRDGRLMPDRAEVDPRGLECALEHAFILEHIAPGVGRIRVSGMHLSDLLGMEVRGMPLTALIAPEARARMARVLDAVVSQPRVADLALSADRGIGRPTLNARLYLAPLGTGTGLVPRVLGCLQAAGEIGRTPRRFAIDQVQMRRIVASRQPEGRPARVQRPMMPGFADTQHTFAVPTSGRPALRLVKSED